MAAKKVRKKRKIKRRRRHFFQATAVNPTTDHAYIGVGATRKKAKTRAQNRALNKGGEVLEDLELLEVKSLVGPPPQTFAGNEDLPDE